MLKQRPKCCSSIKLQKVYFEFPKEFYGQNRNLNKCKAWSLFVLERIQHCVFQYIYATYTVTTRPTTPCL